MTRRDPELRPADADDFLAEAREVRIESGLPFLAVPAPRVRTAVPAAPGPMRGTRLLDLDDDEAPADQAPADEPPDDPDDVPAPAPERDPDDRVDDVDERIERLERRRARTRSRRLLAAWVLLVVLAALAAGTAGWSLGASVLGP